MLSKQSFLWQKNFFKLGSLTGAAVIAVALTLPALAEEEEDFTNEAGNFVFPEHVFSTPGGINPKRRSTSGTGSGTPPRRVNNLNRAKNTLDVLQDLNQDLRNVNRFDEDLENIFNSEVLIDALETKIDNASGGNLPFNFNSFTGGSFGVNREPVPLSEALSGLSEIASQTADAAESAIVSLADTDPFLAFQGSFTNRSATDTINVFLPFEQAFAEPIPIDSGLSRQILVDLKANDTNGDGAASVQEGRIEYFIQGANNITGPDINSTRNLGAVDSLGLSRINERFVDGRRRVSSIDLVNSGDRDRFSDQAGLTHMVGQVFLRDISPGDTVDFTFIISLGVPGNPSLPLLPVEELAQIFDVNQALVTNIPEPTGVLLAGALIGLVGRRRRADC